MRDRARASGDVVSIQARMVRTLLVGVGEYLARVIGGEPVGTIPAVWATAPEPSTPPNARDQRRAA